MNHLKLKKFWDKKARFYPRPFDEKVLKNTITTLEKIKSKGVSFENKKVLDIGCGTGIYTLPIAREALNVVGIDCSPQMTNVLIKEAEKHNINNVHVHIGFWHEIDVVKMGLKNNFDVVTSFMTPAIRTMEDIRKMDECSKKWCVYIGWGRKRENSLMNQIFDVHNIKFKPPGNAMNTANILKEMRRKFYFEFFETFWEWEGSLQDALEDFSEFIKMQSGNPDRDKILAILKKHENNGKIYHKTHVELGLIIWNVAKETNCL
jgi:SAM-dependent methyltransferase